MTERAFVLLLAYGTPASLSDIGDYYTHIRRGRPPSAEQLEELTSRYRAIGGSSPLLAITRAQAQGLERMLQRQSPDREVTVVLGMKHAPPFIEEAVAALAKSADVAVGLVLAPHYSTMSVGEYLGRVRAATATCGGPSVRLVREWHLDPGYIALLADRVRSAIGRLRAEGGDRAHVIFTAHSLPRRILASGDPYASQLADTASAVAEAADLEDWSVAWQSASMTSSEPWLGPDVRDVVRELGSTDRNAVLICPAGFVSDHLEVLYDLDVDCRRVASESGLRYARTASPNADPEFLEALAGICEAQLNTAVA